MSPIQRWAQVAFPVAALVLVACNHSEPFGSEAPDPLGPPTATVPRQLTYNPWDDRSPHVSGALAAYSRYDGRDPVSNCIALLPAEGGSLAALHCPPPPSAADTSVSTWLEPALSPDGDRVAFVWQRGARVSALAAWSHDLVVAAAEDPAAPLVTAVLPQILPGDRFANTAMDIEWSSPTALRFLAAYDSIVKVRGGGASRYTDTTLAPRAVMELDVTSGTIALVQGGDSVVAYATDAAGTVWIVPEGVVPEQLMRLAPDGRREPGALLPYARPTDLAFVDGSLVVAAGVTAIAWGDPAAGGWRELDMPGPVHRVAAAGGRRVIAEVERGESEFGQPADLWLFELPAAAASLSR